MPKISNLRFANIHYGDPECYIDDTIMDLYNGQHTLIKGANGIGKSVLIQEMMAPFMSTLKNRTICEGKHYIDLLSKKYNTPQCVVMEFILDETTEKYMTLIFISKRDNISFGTSTSENETEEILLKEKTYIVHTYTRAQFHINDLCFKNVEKNTFLPYEALCTSIEQMLHDKGLKFRGFTNLINREHFEDKRKFFKMLQDEYGIDKNDWQNIMKTLNKQEGGLSDLFENGKHKNPKQIKAEFIEKNIYGVVNKKVASSDIYVDETFDDIKNAAKNLVEDKIENHVYYNRQEKINKIRKQYQKKENKENINGAIESSLKLQQVKKELVKNYNDLKNVALGFDKRIESCDSEIERLEKEEKKVDEYQLNAEYQNTLAEYDSISESIEKTEKELTQNDCKINNYQDEISKANIGNIKLEIQNLERKLGEVRGKIAKEQDSTDLTRKQREIGACLNYLYTTEEDSIKRKIDDTKNVICSLETKISNETKQLEELNKRNKEYIQKKGALETLGCIMEEKEKKILNDNMLVSLHYPLTKNMFDEYQEYDNGKTVLDKNHEFYIEEASKLSTEIENLENELKNRNKEKEAFQNEIKKNQEDLLNLDKKMNNSKQSHEYLIEKPKQQLIEIIKKHLNISMHIKDEDIQNYKQYTLTHIEQGISSNESMLKNTESEKAKLIKEKNSLITLGESFKNNRVVQEIIDFLNEEGYGQDIITGWEFLEGQEPEEAQKVITLNPLLAQSILVTNQGKLDEILDKLKNLPKEMTIHTDFDYAVLFTTYDSIKSDDQKCEYPNNHVFVVENGCSYFYTAINPILLDEEERKTNIESLTNNIQKIEEKCLELNRDKEYLQNEKCSLINNTYSYEKELSSLREIRDLKQNIETIEKENIEKTESVQNIETEIDKICVQMNILIGKRDSNNERVQLLNEYIELYKKILFNKAEASKNASNLDETNNKINVLNKSIEDASKNISDQKEKQKNYQGNLEELEKQLKKYRVYVDANASTSKYVHESKNELEKMYDIISEDYDTHKETLKELEAKFTDLNEKIKDCREDIQAEVTTCNNRIRADLVNAQRTSKVTIAAIRTNLDEVVNYRYKITAKKSGLDLNLKTNKDEQQKKKNKIFEKGYNLLQLGDILRYSEGYANKKTSIRQTMRELNKNRNSYSNLKVWCERYINRLQATLQNENDTDSVYIHNEITLEKILDEEQKQNIQNAIFIRIGEYKECETALEKYAQAIKKFIDEMVQYCEEMSGIEELLSEFKKLQGEFYTLFEKKDYEELKTYYITTSNIIDDAVVANNDSLKTYEAKFEKCVDQLLKYFRVEYLQMQEVDKKSNVKIFENVKKKKLFSLQLPKFEEKHEDFKVNIRHYLEEQIQIACTQPDGMKKFRLAITPMNIFKTAYPFEKIEIRVAKISGGREEINMQKFEQALKYSGGEITLVCCEILFSILYYGRNDTHSKKNHSSVLIMDNPFAKTSSLELLKPMLKLADAMQIQLIFFTHIENNDDINELFPSLIQLQSLSVSGSEKDKQNYVYAETQPLNEDAVSKEKNVYHMDFVRSEQGQLF